MSEPTVSEPNVPPPSSAEPASHRGLLIVVSGPSGVGKTTITHRLLEQLDAAFSVSMTTRPKTDKDREGEDYYFVDKAHFEAAVERGDLLEWAEVFGNYYGTPRRPVEEHLAAGRNVLLEIDVAGATQVKRRLPEALTIFVLPPNEDSLLQRLRERGREEESVIQKRFAKARHEIETARASGAYDHFVTNDQLDRAVHEARELILNRKESASSESA